MLYDFLFFINRLQEAGSISISVKSKGFISAFKNGFAPVMAKSSIVASTIPKSPINHGNKDDFKIKKQEAL